MHIALIIMLCVLAVAIPLFIYFGLKTNKQYKPLYVIPGTSIGVKYWDDYGKVASDPNDPVHQIAGLEAFILYAKDFLNKRYGTKKAKKMLNFDIWVFHNDSKMLGMTDPSTNGRRSGLNELYYTWWGIRRKWAVRLRNRQLGDITTTALSHEIIWHFVPRMDKGHWNIRHKTDMKPLETELVSSYKAERSNA